MREIDNNQALENLGRSGIAGLVRGKKSFYVYH